MNKIGAEWRGDTVWCMTVVQCKEKWKDQTQRFLTQTWISFTIQWDTGEEEGNEECIGRQHESICYRDMHIWIWNGHLSHWNICGVFETYMFQDFK